MPVKRKQEQVEWFFVVANDPGPLWEDLPGLRPLSMALCFSRFSIRLLPCEQDRFLSTPQGVAKKLLDYIVLF